MVAMLRGGTMGKVLKDSDPLTTLSVREWRFLREAYRFLRKNAAREFPSRKTSTCPAQPLRKRVRHGCHSVENSTKADAGTEAQAAPP